MTNVADTHAPLAAHETSTNLLATPRAFKPLVAKLIATHPSLPERGTVHKGTTGSKTDSPTTDSELKYDPTEYVFESEDDDATLVNTSPPTSTTIGSPKQAHYEVPNSNDLVPLTMSGPLANRYSALYKKLVRTKAPEGTVLTVALVGDMDAAEQFVQDYQARLGAHEIMLWINVREIVALMFTWLGYHETPKMQRTKDEGPNPEQSLNEEQDESGWTFLPPPFIKKSEFLKHAADSTMQSDLKAYIQTPTPLLQCDLDPTPSTSCVSTRPVVHHLLRLLQYPFRWSLNSLVHDITIRDAVRALKFIESLDLNDLCKKGVWGNDRITVYQSREAFCTTVRGWLGLFPRQDIPDSMTDINGTGGHLVLDRVKWLKRHAKGAAWLAKINTWGQEVIAEKWAWYMEWAKEKGLVIDEERVDQKLRGKANTSQLDMKVDREENRQDLEKKADLKDLEKKANLKDLESKADLKDLERKADLKDLETKADLKDLETKANLKDLETKANLKDLESKADLKDLESKADLKDLERKADLKDLETKANLKDLETKANLKDLESKADLKDLERKADLKDLEIKANLKDLESKANRDEVVTKAEWLQLPQLLRQHGIGKDC